MINDVFSLLLANIAHGSPDNCQMLALRTLTNFFSVGNGKLNREYYIGLIKIHHSIPVSGLSLLLSQRDPLITRAVTVLPKSNNRNVEIALATLMLNLSVAVCREGDEVGQTQCLTSIGMLFLDAISDQEAR